MQKSMTLLLCLILHFGIAQDQEWQRQNPLPVLVQLEDVDVDPSGIGLAVGEEGTVFRTTDFGANWEAVESGTALTFLEVSFVPGTGGQQAWAATTGSTRVAHTTDGGQSWSILPIGFNLAAVNYLATPTEDVIYACTQNGLVKTTDQGQSWEEVTPAADQNWASISFVDVDNGWLATTDGAVFKTTDGGANWTEPSPGQFDRPVQLHFLDADRGYAAVFRSFFETTDGGESWQELSSSAFPTNMAELDVLDAMHMVATAGNSNYYSLDGGTTWERELTLPYAYLNRGICGLPDGRVWIAGAHTQIAYSTNFGETHIDQLPGNKNQLRYIGFYDLQHGWAAGQNGAVLRTTDGGATWEDVSYTNETIEEGYVFGPDELLVIADNQVVRTTDGGQTWEVQFSDGSDFTDLTRVENTFYATNRNGKVYRSTDDGDTWEALETPAENWLLGVDFPTAETGYLVGLDSTVLKTTDGGQNWNELAIPTSKNLRRAYFQDPDRGWVLIEGNEAELFHTEDGGSSWSVIDLPRSTFWKEIYFSAPDTGYLVGGSASVGFLLQTTDGGQNWEQIHSTYGLLNSFEQREGPAGPVFWVAGFGGNIERLGEVETTGLAEVETVPLKVFPNPTAGVLNIQVPPNLMPEARIFLYDAQGRLLFSQPAQQPELFLDGLESGWYLLQIRGEERVYRARILVR